MKNITGNWQYPVGVNAANGLLRLQLSQTAVVTATPTVVAPPVVEIQLDADGNIPANISVWANDELSPSTTFYKIAVYTPSAGLIFGSSEIVIAGTAPIDLNNIIPSSTVAMPTYVGAVQVQGTPVAGNILIATDPQNAYWGTIEGASCLLEVAGTPNVNQGVLNFIAGSNVTITSNANGNLTFAVSVPSSQVNADWTAVSGVAEILNKPTLGTAAAQNTAAFDAAGAAATVQTNLNTEVSRAEGVEATCEKTANKGTANGYASLDATTKVPIAQIPTIPYSDLSGTPTIPAAQVNSDWNASTGVAQILNKPTLGTAAAQNTTAFDAAGTSATETSRAEAVESLLVPKTTTINGHALSANVVISATDITTGTLSIYQLPTISYSSLSNLPTIPAAVAFKFNSELTSSQTLLNLLAGTNMTITDNGSGGITFNSTATTSVSWGTVTGTLSNQTDLQTALNAKANTSSLAPVATSGAYSSLSGLPTLVTSFSGLTGALAMGQIPSGGSSTTYLRGDGSWDTPSVGGASVELATNGTECPNQAVFNLCTLGGLTVNALSNGSVTLAAAGNVQTKTTSYVTGIADSTIIMNSTSATSVTLTTSSLTTGSVYRVVNGNTGVVTVIPATGNIIGQSSITLPMQYMAADFVFDGTNFWVD